MGNGAKGTGAFAVIVGTEFRGNLFNVIYKPAPNRSLLDVVIGIHFVGMHAVADIEDVLFDAVHQLCLLAPHFAIAEIAGFLRDFAQHVDHFARSVTTRTTGFARHALPTVPYGFGAKQFLDDGFVVTLHQVADAARVIIVELRRRTHCCAHSAVHAGVQRFVVTQILFNLIQQISHNQSNFTRFSFINLKKKLGSGLDLSRFIRFRQRLNLLLIGILCVSTNSISVPSGSSI